MKILIIYASKNGVAKKSAELLSSELHITPDKVKKNSRKAQRMSVRAFS